MCPAPRRLDVAIILALVAVSAASCRRSEEQPSPWPEGTLLLARTAALERLGARLGALQGTPLAREAAVLLGRLPGCTEVESRSLEGSLSELAEGLACRRDPGEPSVLDAERGPRDLAFASPGEGGGHLVGVADVGSDGGLDLELRLPSGSFRDVRALLLPGDQPPGPDLLSGSERLLHARVRPEDGIDLAALVPEDSQGALLFRLKSELFAGAALDGTWEAAFYLPEPGASMPRVAAALGFSRRALAIAAMDGFIDELRSTWPVRRSFFSLGPVEGACLLDLRILPEFAPCYVATDRALVVGWNPASLRKGLDGAPGDSGGGSRISAELARFAEADARLAEADADAPAARFPWRRLHATGSRDAERIVLRVRLEPEPGG
jgi:hypothetical protein